jgi:D-amino-acid dehydrogenase
VRVIVVGGGVVGLCCAWALQGRHDVVVVERDAMGGGASSGNAGWVTSALSGPLAAPGVVRKGLRWLAKPDSPLLIHPRADSDFLRWLWHFARNCRASSYARGLAATLELSRLTHDVYRDLLADGVTVEHRRTGLVCAAASDTGWRECQAMRAELVEHGYAGTVTPFEGGAVTELDSALRPSLAGALHFESDWHVDPLQLCQSLASKLAGRGVDLRPQSEVRMLRSSGGEWTAQLARGSIVGDRVVIASGVWTPRLLRLTGARLLIQPAKGYSVTGRAVRPPAHPIYMHEAKVGCSPYEGRTRLAGTLELGGLDPAIEPRRVAAIEQAATRYLSDWKLSDARVWAGFRSATPDGLPYIGNVPGRPGLMVAAGHGTLGVTLAPATGVALARALDTGASPILDPFRLDRPRS